MTVPIVQSEQTEFGKEIETKTDIYGLSDEGNLYRWVSKFKRYERPNIEGDTGEYIYGWKLLEDEINK